MFSYHLIFPEVLIRLKLYPLATLQNLQVPYEHSLAAKTLSE